MARKSLSRLAKGGVIESPMPWMLVSLSPSQNGPFNLDGCSQLPRYDTTIVTPADPDYTGSSEQDDDLENFIIRILRSPSMPVYILVATLRILRLKGEGLEDELQLAQKKSLSTRDNEALWNNDEERDMTYEGWALIQHFASWERFVVLYVHVRQHMHLTSMPHPLTEYVTKVFPLLNPSEQEVAAKLLQRVVHKKYAHATALRLSYAVLEACHQRPCMFAVLLESPHTSSEFSSHVRHSCLPNAAWDVTRTTSMAEGDSTNLEVNLVALYDLEAREDVSVAMVDITLPYKERTEALGERFGQSDRAPCECCRCRYERDGSTPNLRDLQRLGHVAFQQGRYEEAQRFYRVALEKDVNLPEIWHALGAVYLQQQRFCQAQQHWKDAVEKHMFLKRHMGIALQLEKQTAYRYWDSHTEAAENAHLPKYRDVFRGLCFATKEPVATAEDCKRVIGWAEDASGGWTTSRHYAVPTTDVPVHEVADLLQWFMESMATKIYPLLSAQFPSLDTKRWYVHDAFVARYDALQKNNHLPLHLDESTHSFVLSLNEDYEGGGTYFEGLDQTIDVAAGNMLSFRGDTLRHGGSVVAKGVRYILAVFLYLDNRPDLSVTEESSPAHKRCKLHHVFQDEKRKKEEEKHSFSFGFDLPTKT